MNCKFIEGKGIVFFIFKKFKNREIINGVFFGVWGRRDIFYYFGLFDIYFLNKRRYYLIFRVFFKNLI